MPRVVHPWTWPRALRDHGPKSADDRNFTLALLALHTFVDGESGSTFVGVRTWAVAARMSVNTLMPLRDRANAEGWVHLSSARGAARKAAKSLYRLTVPDHVPLSSKDESLRDVILSTYGEVPQTVSRKADTDSTAQGRTVSVHADTDRETCGYPIGRNAAAPKSVSVEPANCVSGDGQLCQSDRKLCEPRGDTEVCSKSIQQEVCTKGHAAARAAADEQERAKADQLADRIERVVIEHLLAGVDLGKKPKQETIAILGKQIKATDAEIEAAVERLKDAGRLPVKRRGTSRLPDIVT